MRLFGFSMNFQKQLLWFDDSLVVNGFRVIYTIYQLAHSLTHFSFWIESLSLFWPA